MRNWDPLKGVRLVPAWRAIITLLADDEQHEYQAIMACAHQASPSLRTATIENVLRSAVKLGLLWRMGSTSLSKSTLQITKDEHIRQHPAIAWVWRP